MVEWKKLECSKRITTLSLDEALREHLPVAVKYTVPDGDNCTIRGISECHDKEHIKVFDKALGKWIFILIGKIRKIGTCKQIDKIEEDLPHSNRLRSIRSRRRSRKPFSYRRWWKDDTVQEDIDYEKWYGLFFLLHHLQISISKTICLSPVKSSFFHLILQKGK